MSDLFKSMWKLASAPFRAESNHVDAQPLPSKVKDSRSSHTRAATKQARRVHRSPRFIQKRRAMLCARKTRRAQQPDRYYQKDREARRARDIRLAHLAGGHSRHEDDPQGSAHWVEYGYWPQEVRT